MSLQWNFIFVVQIFGVAVRQNVQEKHSETTFETNLRSK